MEKTIAFSLYLYNTGKYKVRTKSGEEVKDLKRTGCGAYPIMGHFGDASTMESWSVDGELFVGKENPLDLVLIAKD